MEADLEQIFVGLKLGFDSLKLIAQAVTDSSISADLNLAASLVRRAADLIAQHIDVDSISILRRDIDG